MIHKTFSFADLNITLPEIYEQMQIPADNVAPDVQAEVENMLAKIEKFLRPEICFYIGKGELDEENFTLNTNGRLMNIGKIIARQLRGSSLFAFFVCTAGQAYQDFMEEMHRTGDMMLEFTANAIGSVLAEKTADLMERELEKILGGVQSAECRVQSSDTAQSTQNSKLKTQNSKLKTQNSAPCTLHSAPNHTNRFSPGYCGWHVREQQLLFSTFPVEKPCGVTLTPSSLMLPIKSVSGILGIGENVRKLDYTCGLCDYAKCYKRRKRKDAEK